MRTTPERLALDYRARGAWADTRIGDLFAASAALDPQRTAVVDPPNRESLDGAAPRRLTWQSLSSLVDVLMVSLTDAGVRRDDVLITQLPNIVEYVAVYVACARLGIVLSPVPMQFRLGELEPVCELTRAVAILTVKRFKDTEPAALAATIAQRPKVLLIDELSAQPSSDVSVRAASLAATANVHADDIFTICWTSGTEGGPKGVPRSHNHWLAGSWAHFDGAQIRTGDKLLNPFPLVNMAAIGGCFLSWLRAAGTLLLHHPFELSIYLQQIATERPEYAIAPPAVLMLLLQNEALLKNVDLSCLRCIGSGSAPLPPIMIKTYKDRYGIEIVNNFGSNEGVAFCCGPLEAPSAEQRAQLFPRFGRRELDWTQKTALITETRLIDPETEAEILAPETAGEMQIRGPVVFDGYFGAPAITARVFTQDGWFRTGDLFEIDTTSRFYRFIGRLRQQINRGGMKISPEELDAILAEHPDVAEAASVGFPDDVLGERVCAVVALKPQRTLTVEGLQAHFKARGLAVFKWPERVRIVERLPRNPVGKVLRNEIARIAATKE